MPAAKPAANGLANGAAKRPRPPCRVLELAHGRREFEQLFPCERFRIAPSPAYLRPTHDIDPVQTRA